MIFSQVKCYRINAQVSDIEDTCFFVFVLFFQCKIEFYFTEWTPKAVFSRVAVATSENTGFGVHE